MYLKLNSDDDVVSFALLHKTDYDPYRKHKNPYVLDYIYTYTNYRNMGHAQSLINAIKQKHEFTALCSSDLSSLVFHKCSQQIYSLVKDFFVLCTFSRLKVGAGERENKIWVSLCESK